MSRASIMQIGAINGAPHSHQEIYKHWYSIDVFVHPARDGKFNSYGSIRHIMRDPAALKFLPHEYTFDSRGRRHATAYAALQAGLGFARAKIDATYKRPSRAGEAINFEFFTPTPNPRCAGPSPIGCGPTRHPARPKSA